MLPKDQCHIMWLLYRFEGFPNHPNFVRDVHVVLDEQTVRDGHSCQVTGSFGPDKASVRVTFDMALSAAAQVHESQSTKATIQKMRNDAALEGGPLSGKSTSFEPLKQATKSLSQARQDAPAKTTWQLERTKLPIFVTANVPLEVKFTSLTAKPQC